MLLFNKSYDLSSKDNALEGYQEEAILHFHSFLFLFLEHLNHKVGNKHSLVKNKLG